MRSVASNVTLSNVPKVGRTIKATYQYSETNGNAEGSTFVNYYLSKLF